MKIMQLVSGSGLNGAVRHCYDLTCALADRGHEVWIGHRAQSWVARQPYPSNVVLFETSLSRNRTELGRVAEMARHEGIQILHSHNSSSHFFGVLLARGYGLRSIATCHMPHFQPHWRWNDRVIAPAQNTASFQRWINWVPKTRIDVIPYFIDASRSQPMRSKLEIQNELGIGPTDFAITAVGEVSDRKSQHTLIEALPHLIRAGISPRLFLVGKIDDRYGAKCKKIIQELSLEQAVSMLGQRADVADILSVSRCVCLSSKREVMPFALLEAMSVGLPVLSTNVGGVAECIRDGIDGFILKRSPIAFAYGLIRLANDPECCKQLGGNARRNVATRFSRESCLAQIEETYRTACQIDSRMAA
jgi:glycosyltransferase involved in cell wall biosynthesis